MKDTYESPLCSRYASDYMKHLFSPDMRYRTWRRLWTELARSECSLGLPVTAEQVAELEAHIEDIDYDVVAAREKENEAILADKRTADEQMQELLAIAGKQREELQKLQKQIEEINASIEEGKNTIIGELNQRAVIRAKMGRFDTMMEQINIRRAELNSKLLRAKSDEAAREETLKALESAFEKVTEELRVMTEQEAASEAELRNIRESLI